ncbi:hypothetical protein Tco_0488749 [Tanacetum coccineum]
MRVLGVKFFKETPMFGFCTNPNLVILFDSVLVKRSSRLRTPRSNELCHENTSGTKSNHNASLHHGPGRIVTKTLSDRIMSYVDEHPSENHNSSRASNVAGKISDYKRTMRRDLTRYEELDKEAQAQLNIELSGWKPVVDDMNQQTLNFYV